MKILLTGGGTAGHFYPLIAIAEALNDITEKEKLIRPDLYYISTSPFDKKLLFDNDITFIQGFSGKKRIYASVLNIFSYVSVFVGLIKALWDLYFLYPDLVISKGGYASVPVTLAAKILKIPVLVHESDSVPGRANVRAAKYAARIAVSYPEAAKNFPQEKTAVTGQPIRKEILIPVKQRGLEYLGLVKDIPVVLILGGSQGAQRINDTVADILPKLVEHYQVIHQTGLKNINEIKKLSEVLLTQSPYKERYKPFGFLNSLALKMAAGTANLVVSRAGSIIFEIAAWGLPSIIIPITESHGNHQYKNAFNYARSGASVVLEEANLTPHVFFSEIERLVDNPQLLEKMHKAAWGFFASNAAEKVAREALKIALGHEK